MEDEATESSDARKARLRALRDAPEAPAEQPATHLPQPFQQEAAVHERAAPSFYSDPMEAFESRRQEGRGAAELPPSRQRGDVEPDFLGGGDDGLPTAFASSRGARGRGGGASQQRPAKVPRQEEAPRPQGNMGGRGPLGGRGGPRDGGHDQRRGNDRRGGGGGGGLDAYINRSMLEDPWAQLVHRLQLQGQHQMVFRQLMDETDAEAT